MKKEETKETVKKPVVDKRETRTLKCDLTNDELLTFGARMADAQQKIVECESELKSFKDQIGGKKAMAEAEVGQFGSYVRQKYMHRAVECDAVYDYNAETVIVIRRDNMEVVDSGKMSKDELSRLPM